MKMLTPPLLWDLIRKLLHKEEGNITFAGQYASFQDVVDKHPSVTNYHTKNSLQDNVLLAKQNISGYLEGDAPSSKWQNFRVNILPTVLSTAAESRTFRILDVGGELGASYINLKIASPSIKCNYTILELADTAAHGNELFRDFSDIEFISTFPSENECFDIVLFGSSLQYFEKYADAINTVCHYRPEIIILTDHAMGITDTFVSAQVNIRDRVIPMLIFNLEEIILLFSANGYDCKLKTISHYPFHEFSNFGNNVAKLKFYNLVFKAKTNS